MHFKKLSQNWIRYLNIWQVCVGSLSVKISRRWASIYKTEGTQGDFKKVSYLSSQTASELWLNIEEKKWCAKSFPLNSEHIPHLTTCWNLPFIFRRMNSRVWKVNSEDVLRILTWRLITINKEASWTVWTLIICRNAHAAQVAAYSSDMKQ